MSQRLYRRKQQLVMGWLLALVVLAALAVRPSAVSVAGGTIGNIHWFEVYHDSRDPMYRTPGGATPINTDVTLRLRTMADDVTAVTLRFYNTKLKQDNYFWMPKVATDGVYDWYEYTVNTGAVPNIFYYRFILTDVDVTAYYEDDDRYGGAGTMFGESVDNSWALTVYDPAFSTPDWVKNAVFYQVFVDRFRDGDPSNNNLPGELFYGEANTIVRSNTSDWNTPLCDPRADTNDTCEGSYSRNFYGGDLQGIIDKLPYLDELGVTALYLNPIFESPSNHKYDTSDFSVIDDNFGDLDTFHELVDTANALGIKIVLDGVFNHASSMSPYFDRYGDHSIVGACESISSYYAPMFKFYADMDTPTCSDNRDYPYWFGIFDSLAVLENENQFARDAVWGAGIIHPANQPDGDPVAVGTYWIEQGAAGWRLDVAPEIDHGFIQHTDTPYYSNYWENFRAAVHAVDPDAYIVGEEWGMSQGWTSGGVDNFVSTDGNPGEWDATMNYQQSAALLSFWRDSPLHNENDFNPGSSAGQLDLLSPSVFVERYLNLKERYSPEAFAAMMNLLGSHDTQRALWLLAEDHPGGPADGTVFPADPSYDWSDATRRLHGAALMQFTLEGAPQIYYGDEIGLVAPATYAGDTWQDDPYNRIPYPWDDETGTPYYTVLTNSAVRDANFAYYKALTTARNTHPALRTGGITFLLADDATKRLAYLRQLDYGSDSAIVLINRGGVSQDFSVALSGRVAAGTVYDDALTPAVETYMVDANGVLSVSGVASNAGVLLVQTSAAVLPPTAPNDVTATADFMTLQINLAWTATGADSYDVYRSLVSGGGYQLIGSTIGTTFTDAAVDAVVRYYYVVVAKDETTLLESEFSNEADARIAYDLSGAYLNVQWPGSLNQTISTEDETDTVYGQLYLGGVTDTQSTPVAGIVAQLGWGPQNSDPTGVDWQWVDMVPNEAAGGANNDEFMGSLLPDQIGTFSYTIRYSGDRGETWRYAWHSDVCPILGDYVYCTLMVVPSSDVTPPTAPTLLKLYDVSNDVLVSWSGATDDVEIGRYRVYRDGILLAEVDDLVSSYRDQAVAAGTTYEYTVTAVDTSFNEGPESNTITAVTVTSLVDVKFVVTVPPFTPSGNTIQVIGDPTSLTGFGGSGVNMTPTGSPGEYEVTVQIPEMTTFQYKYRRDGSWDKVEKDVNGYDEVVGPNNNREYSLSYAESGPYTITDGVANWRDVLVTSTTPTDGAVGVDPATTIVATFNKSINISESFSVTDFNGDPVAGTFAANNSGSPTLTFTPSDTLCHARQYTVNVSGVNAAGDGQQFDAYPFSFTVGGDAAVDVTFNVTVPGFTPDGGTIYLSGTDAAFGTGLAMTETAPGVWSVTVEDLPDCDTFEVWAHRGSSGTSETDAATGLTLVTHPVTVSYGDTGAQTIDLTVGNWYDPIVTAIVPVDGATDVSINTTVQVTFSKVVDAGSTFTLKNSLNEDVAGAFAYDAGTRTITFTPDEPLDYDTTYAVDVSGVSGTDASVQVEPASASFTTEKTIISVTWTVTVPAFTPTGSTVYISGNHASLGSDDLDAVAMTNSAPNTWTFTASFIEGTSLTYTFSRGDENTRATLADGETLISETFTVNGGGSLTQSRNNTIENWRDPVIVASSPADNASQMPTNTPVSVTFSKPVNPSTSIVVFNSEGVGESGMQSYDAMTNTVTFTPDAGYRYADTITAMISGFTGAVSGTQIGSLTITFQTEALDLLRNGGFEDIGPKANYIAPWVVVNKTGDKRKCDTSSVPVVSGNCAFKFRGSAAENMMLEQTVDLTGVTFAAGDELILSAYHNNNSTVKMNMLVIIKYSDAPKEKIKQKVTATNKAYQLFSTPAAPLATANVTNIKVRFKHKSKAGRTFIDDVSLLLRQGNTLRLNEMVAPLPPPSLPSGFRGN